MRFSAYIIGLGPYLEKPRLRPDIPIHASFYDKLAHDHGLEVLGEVSIAQWF